MFRIQGKYEPHHLRKTPGTVAVDRRRQNSAEPRHDARDCRNRSSTIQMRLFRVNDHHYGAKPGSP